MIATGRGQVQQAQELAQQASSMEAGETEQMVKPQGAIVLNPDGCTFSFAVREAAAEEAAAGGEKAGGGVDGAASASSQSHISAGSAPNPSRGL